MRRESVCEPKSFRYAVSGRMIQLSSEVPSDDPSFFPTPITMHGKLFQRISLPTGSTAGIRLPTMSMPITQAGDALFRSASVMWRPSTRSTS